MEKAIYYNVQNGHFEIDSLQTDKETVERKRVIIKVADTEEELKKVVAKMLEDSYYEARSMEAGDTLKIYYDPFQRGEREKAFREFRQVAGERWTTYQRVK